MDKIWWNEQWMGWPVGPHYAEQSNVTNAHKLTGKLLLIVGELDRNVDPATTMQVVNALIKADKDFDLLVVPGAGHGAGGNALRQKKDRTVPSPQPDRPGRHRRRKRSSELNLAPSPLYPRERAGVRGYSSIQPRRHEGHEDSHEEELSSILFFVASFASLQLRGCIC